MVAWRGTPSLQHNRGVKLVAWRSRASNDKIDAPPMGYSVLVTPYVPFYKPF
jgi:hypothetical protein